MALEVGARFGHYDVTALLGEGGMGQVYRATDTRLGRQVALKVLPEAFAADPDRLARFQREAQVLASLNHPGIAQIYGTEDDPTDGTRALVLELVEGPTLADRIARGRIPVDEALANARQIAEALEAAHEAGVVHRDLKPANIKVRPDGTVKVLDFGLAKALQPEPGEASASTSPTISLTAAATAMGMVIGTAAYMSPEQARGKPVDKRADIWAFGCVLYEMLTGRRAFEGEETPVILASVISGEVDLDLLPAGLHPAIRRLVARCLSKDPTKRLRDIGDARIELDEVGVSAPAPTPPAPHNRTGWLVAAGLGAVAVVALLAAWRAARPDAPELRPLVRLDVDLGADVSLGSPSGVDVILSPDGTRLVYVSGSRLFTRRLDQATATELPGTDGAYAPVFSPDGQSVAFFADESLRVMPVQGGPVVDLCDCAVNPGGASWGDDGFIVAQPNLPGPLVRVAADGGPPQEIPGTRPRVPIWPHVLPGSAAVLYATVEGPAVFERATIDVYSFADGRRKTLVQGATFPRYVASGHLTYISEGALLAVPFDLEALEIRGEPVQVLDQVTYDSTRGFAQLDLGASGTLVYQAGTARGDLDVVQWVGAEGEMTPVLRQPGFYAFPRLSPDGRHLVVGQGIGDRGAGVWVHELAGDRAWPVSSGAGLVSLWTPDGRYVVFGGPNGLFWAPFDAADPPQPLETGLSGQLDPLSFAPDGTLAIRVSADTSGFDMWTVPVEIGLTGLRAGEAEPLLASEADERFFAFSPDGRWMAYASNESGAYEVSVRAYPDTGRRWPVSSGGGTDPVWSPTGAELFYRTSDNALMVAPYTVVGDELVADASRPFTSRSIPPSAINPAGLGVYDVGASGRRILVAMSAQSFGDEPAPRQVVFLQGFLDELRRRVPVE